MIILKPCKEEVEKYLIKWNTLENYVLQEKSLDKLFFDIIPENNEIEDVLIKCSTLNDFYSTNIFSIFPVAKKIYNLNIDERLKKGDLTLVNDITYVEELNKHFYSFATKYCSHHNPHVYPIYDSYVDKILRYFRKEDNFCKFKNDDLKNYLKFNEILQSFIEFYNLKEYNIKQIDKYLWQLGKKYFKKKY